MTVTDPVITDAPDEGAPPIYDTDRLKARIAKLPPERMSQLGEMWTANGLGVFNGLVDAETYRKAEHLVAAAEESAQPIEAHHLLWQQLATIPAHIAEKAVEALGVYAGQHDRAAGPPLLTSVGRLAEYERIIGEAVTYAAEVAEAGVSSVTELPVADDTGDLVASADYPGSKADAKTVLAWVGGDINRAARAYALEQERATVRKGLTAKLIDILGPEGVAKVNEAIAAAAPPPLDLSAGVPPSTPADEKGAAGPGVAAPEASVGSTTPASEAEPAAPAFASATPIITYDPEKLGDTLALAMEERVARAFESIGAGFLKLAAAVREVE